MTGRIELVFNRFDLIAAELPEMAAAVTLRTAYAIQADAQTSMKGGGTPHEPSAPGEPPHVDTGFLKSSILAGRMGATNAEVSVGAEYGIFLEYGTTKMAARPFLLPAVRRHEAEFVEACKRMLASLGGGK